MMKSPNYSDSRNPLFCCGSYCLNKTTTKTDETGSTFWIIDTSFKLSRPHYPRNCRCEPSQLGLIRPRGFASIYSGGKVIYGLYEQSNISHFGKEFHMGTVWSISELGYGSYMHCALHIFWYVGLYYGP